MYELHNRYLIVLSVSVDSFLEDSIIQFTSCNVFEIQQLLFFVLSLGFHCEQCLSDYYDWSMSGCQQCPCYHIGSETLECMLVEDDVTCNVCKQGYVGALCDQ